MTLDTPRLLLRELCVEDGPALNEIDRDPRVTRYLPYDPQSLDQTRAYIEGAIREQSDDPRRTYDLAIVPRVDSLPQETQPRAAVLHQADATIDPSRGLIGRCGLGIRRPEHREAVIWYMLHPGHSGRGYAVEAATALLHYGFTVLGLHRIWADCDPRNTASCRVASKLGMMLEGHLRENYYLKGEWCGTAVYGILENEWRGGGARP